MANLKDHQQAMVDLLASGSGIPASASRLAHAMHDVLKALQIQSAARDNAGELREFINSMSDPSKWISRAQETSPGLNDKALSKREKPVKTDSPAKWPTSAEQRVKELENTCGQLRNNLRVERAKVEELEAAVSLLQKEIFDLRGLPND